MIAIIGRGNVASHLYKALKDKTEVCLVNSHSLEGFPPNPEIILICVSDDAIDQVANKIPSGNSIIAHTSGSVPMRVLEKKGFKAGVFYPLQTFSKDAELNYKEIPVFIEGSTKDVVESLKKLASIFSDDVREADSDARKQLHLASVFACNFTNALASISKDLISQSKIDFSALLPLMKQTIEKLRYLSPKEAQTGPAVRKDLKVIESHLKMLGNKPEIQELYSRLTKIITDQYQ